MSLRAGRLGIATGGMLLTLGLGGAVLSAAPAYACTGTAEYGSCNTTASTLATSPSSQTSTSPSAAPTATASAPASSGQLAFTGADVALMSAVGAAAIGGGAILVAGSRRRRASA